MYEKYNSQGLEIIAQPCNQFGKQEPLEGQALWTHISGKYGPLYTTFTERADVNGDDATPLFLYLQNHKNCKGFISNSLKWNFTKFLVGRDGVPIKRYGPKDEPVSAEKDIIKALAKNEEL